MKSDPNVISIRRAEKSEHAALQLWDAGMDSAIEMVESLDSIRALVIGGVIGGIVTVLVILTVAWITSLLTF